MVKKSKETKTGAKETAEKRMEELMPESLQKPAEQPDSLEMNPEEINRLVNEAKAAYQEKTGGVSTEGQETATISSVLGEISWMMAMSPTHKYFFFADLEWMVMTPVVLNQFRIYRDDNGKPAALVLWARVSDEVEKRLMEGGTRLAPQDWKSGDRLWVVDIIDLMGGKAEQIVADMKETVFGGKTFRLHSTDEKGVRRVVEI